jgi:hypothetical protein
MYVCIHVPEVELLDATHLLADACAVRMVALTETYIDVLEEERDDLEVVGQACVYVCMCVCL